MDGIFYSYRAENLIDSDCQTTAQLLTKIWDKHVASRGDFDRRCVLLVDTGKWLKQCAWQDQTGYFLKIRLAPLHSGRPDVQAKGRKVLDAFIDLFPHRKAEYVDGDSTFRDGHQETVTVVVHTSSHSIGD